MCLLLFAVALVGDRALIGPDLANGLSALLIALAVAWTLRGPEKLTRLAELYLWLAPILSLSLLQIPAQSLASRMGVDWIVVYRPVAVVHVLLAGMAAWALAARSPKSNAIRLAGRFLIVGAVVFWVGARTFPGTDLEAVSTHLAGHTWTAANFMLATVVTIPGLTCFTRALRAAGDRSLAAWGLGGYLFGAVLWIVHLTIRLTLMRTAARHYADTGSAPAWFAAWWDAAGVLFGIYSVLAYLAIVAYGVALLRTRLLPRWTGWTCIVVGLLAAPLVGPPFWIHVVLWLVGLTLLRRRPLAH